MPVTTAPENSLVFCAQTHSQVDKQQFYAYLLDHSTIHTLTQKLKFKFNDPKKLLNSLCHSSFCHEHPRFFSASNETLEFLGDALLGAIAADELLRRLPTAPEGQLSSMRGSLVNATSLASLGRFVGLPDCLLLGKGEIKNGGLSRDSILSDAFEALLGAIYLDSDFATLKRVLTGVFEGYTEATGDELFSLERIQNFDYKTQLQEKSMAEYKTLPKYSAEQLQDSSFAVRLEVGGQAFGPLLNASKKRAQKLLAKQALDQWRGTDAD